MTRWVPPATPPRSHTWPRKPHPIQRRGTMDERTSRSPVRKDTSSEELRKPRWPMVLFSKLYADPSRNGIYKSKQHHGTGVRIVNMGDLFAHDVINSRDTDMKRVRMTESEMTVSGLAENDLLFGRRSLVESGAGKCSLVGKLTEPTTFESSIIRVRVNQSLIRSRFVFYWLRSHQGRGRMQAIVTGTNVKGIRSSVLKTLQVPCPPLHVQDTVVSILRAYDDLIENNRRRIRLLEQVARMIYEEWFVRLRFPGHERVRVTNGMPDGWKRTRLGKVISELESGKRPRGGSSVEGVPSIGAENILGLGQYEYGKEKFIPADYFASMNKGIVKNRDVVIYKDGANIGRSSYFGGGFPHERCAVNEHVFRLQALPEIGQNFLYFYVNLS